MQPINFTKT